MKVKGFQLYMILFFSDQLRAEVDFDASALMELQLALYVVHEAVSNDFCLFSVILLQGQYSIVHQNGRYISGLQVTVYLYLF